MTPADLVARLQAIAQWFATHRMVKPAADVSTAADALTSQAQEIERLTTLVWLVTKMAIEDNGTGIPLRALILNATQAALTPQGGDRGNE